MAIDLDNIPKTVRLLRANASDAPVPVGFPIFEILDQRLLPREVKFERITDWREVIVAIKELRVRGAPAIGIAGAAAMVLRAAEFCYASTDFHRVDELDFDRVFVIDDDKIDPELLSTSMLQSASMIKAARPTAVNLAWAVDATFEVAEKLIFEGRDPAYIVDALFDHVEAMIECDEETNRQIGKNGADLLPMDACVLTHCNAGSLATAFFGTALGVIYTAAERGGVRMVYADETRPVCQGSRLTAFELSRAGVPVTLICDDMAASVLAGKGVDAVVVGADRIAANGDVANKIGTLGLAIMAAELGIAFYVAAPISSIDLDTKSGEDIEIEIRDEDEILPCGMKGVEVYNPAFDVTPAKYIDFIITERGVFKPCDIADAFKAEGSTP